MCGYIGSVNRKQSKIWEYNKYWENIIFKNIELIKKTKSKYVVMKFGVNDCDCN